LGKKDATKLENAKKKGCKDANRPQHWGGGDYVGAENLEEQTKKTWVRKKMSVSQRRGIVPAWSKGQRIQRLANMNDALGGEAVGFLSLLMNARNVTIRVPRKMLCGECSGGLGGGKSPLPKPMWLVGGGCRQKKKILERGVVN